MTVDEELKVGNEGGVFSERCIAVEIASDVVFEGGDVGIAFVGMNGEAFHGNRGEGFRYGRLHGMLCGGDDSALCAVSHDGFCGFAGVGGGAG